MLISGELIVLCKPNFTKKERKRRVTLAFASHLLSPTMSDSEIGGQPAINQILLCLKVQKTHAALAMEIKNL